MYCTLYLIHTLEIQLDCSLRSLALAYGASIFRPGDRTASKKQSMNRLHDALNLGVCPNLQKQLPISTSRSHISVPSAKIPTIVFYVSALHGADTNDGTTPSKPFRTIARAQKAARTAAAASGQAVTIRLRGGTYFGAPPSSSSEPLLHLTPDDNGASATARVTYASYPGEQAVLSGGVSLQGLKWERAASGHSPSAGPVYRTVIPSGLVPVGQSFTGLFWGNFSDASPSKRLTRARYPNCADITGTDCFQLNASAAIKGRVTRLVSE